MCTACHCVVGFSLLFHHNNKQMVLAVHWQQNGTWQAARQWVSFKTITITQSVSPLTTVKKNNEAMCYLTNFPDTRWHSNNNDGNELTGIFPVNVWTLYCWTELVLEATVNIKRVFSSCISIFFTQFEKNISYQWENKFSPLKISLLISAIQQFENMGRGDILQMHLWAVWINMSGPKVPKIMAAQSDPCVRSLTWSSFGCSV